MLPAKPFLPRFIGDRDDSGMDGKRSRRRLETSGLGRSLSYNQLALGDGLFGGGGGGCGVCGRVIAQPLE